MKKIAFAISFLLITFGISAQTVSEKEISTDVSQVKVFLKGAQETRTKSITLSPGTQLLKFTQLTSDVDTKSIQVKASGAVTVVSVNFQKNFLKENEESEEQKKTQKRD